MPHSRQGHGSWQPRAAPVEGLVNVLGNDPARTISKLSHELRTPVQVLNGYLDILSEDWGKHLQAEPQRIIARLRLNAFELTQTVENLLEHSAILAGSLVCAIESVDLAALIGELAPGFSTIAHRKKLALRWRIQRGFRNVESDRRLFRSILSNLVSNALKFTHTGGVTVRLFRTRAGSENSVELEVADTGIGIEPDRVDEAFLPFVQLSDLNTRRHRGLGLGLSLVGHHVGRLGGRLELESTPAQGTCLRVHLPQGTPVKTRADRIARA